MKASDPGANTFQIFPAGPRTWRASDPDATRRLREARRRLGEVRMIRDVAARDTDLPLGYCLDSCHLLAAGFDVAAADDRQSWVRPVSRQTRL